MKRNKNVKLHTGRNANQITIMVKSAKRSQKRNVITKTFPNTKMCPKKNVLRKPFQNATVFQKNIAIHIPFQNAIRFHNNTAKKSISKDVMTYPFKFQLRSRKAFVFGRIKDTVKMTTIASQANFLKYSILKLHLLFKTFS